MPEQQTNNSKSSIALIVFRIVFTCFVILTVIFIFSNSGEISQISTGRSVAVTNALNGLLARANIGVTLTENHVRKLAHMAEFALLGFWLMLTLRIYTKRILSFIAWPLFLGLSIAVMDEFLQGYISGRSSEVTDIVLDFAGILLGLFCGLFVLLLFSAIWRALRGKEAI